MKFNYLLVPASALALAACGSEPEGPKTAEEIAEAVLFLATGADYITGQQINLNGGAHM